MYIRDSYDEFVLHEAEQAERLKGRPICCSCNEHIQEEFAIQYNGDWFCEDCKDDFIDIVMQEFRERVAV